MQYAILCYDSEAAVTSWSKEEDAALMERLSKVQAKYAARGKLGPVARLMPTTTATTLRKGRETMVVDGPFAETKEQLLGFYLVDCDTLEEAHEFARQLAGAATHGSGTYEIRPVMLFRPGAFGQ
ncbi:MAG: YciI family protein [Parvibaculaceae bacterium]